MKSFVFFKNVLSEAQYLIGFDKTLGGCDWSQPQVLYVINIYI